MQIFQRNFGDVPSPVRHVQIVSFIPHIRRGDRQLTAADFAAVVRRDDPADDAALLDCRLERRGGAVFMDLPARFDVATEQAIRRAAVRFWQATTGGQA